MKFSIAQFPTCCGIMMLTGVQHSDEYDWMEFIHSRLMYKRFVYIFTDGLREPGTISGGQHFYEWLKKYPELGRCGEGMPSGGLRNYNHSIGNIQLWWLETGGKCPKDDALCDKYWYFTDSTITWAQYRSDLISASVIKMRTRSEILAPLVREAFSNMERAAANVRVA